MTLHTASIETPIGALAVVVDDDGTVVASGFGDLAEVLSWLPTDLAGQPVVPDAESGSAARAVRDYLAGDVDALGRVAVRQPGGPFQQQAWHAMREIPAGQTWSYAELATKAGHPSATRAAGTACARNRVAPFVPCHRVVRSDGSLGGYAYGPAAKRWLLEHERGADVLG